MIENCHQIDIRALYTCQGGPRMKLWYRLLTFLVVWRWPPHLMTISIKKRQKKNIRKRQEFQYSICIPILTYFPVALESLPHRLPAHIRVSYRIFLAIKMFLVINV